MARFYGPDAAERLQERKLRGNTPPNTERRGRTATALTCDNCYRETEFLFEGFVLPLGKDHIPQKFRNTVMALSAPFQTTPGKVCFRCRPPSNLEIQEILSDAQQRRRRAKAS